MDMINLDNQQEWASYLKGAKAWTFIKHLACNMRDLQQTCINKPVIDTIAI